MPVILRSASVGLQLPLLGRFPGTAMALLSVKFYCFILIDLSQFHPFQSLKNASPEFSRSETVQASREIPLPAPIRNLSDQLQWKRLLIRQPYRPLAGFIAGQLVLKPRNCLRAGIQADVPLGGGKTWACSRKSVPPHPEAHRESSPVPPAKRAVPLRPERRYTRQCPSV